MASARVIISGLGFITSIGNDRAAVSASLRRLRSGIARLEFPAEAHSPVQVAGTIKEFSTSSPRRSDWRWPARYALGSELLSGLTPAGLYAACALEQAMADAGLSPPAPAGEDTGIYLASAGFASSSHALVAAGEEIRAGRRRRIAVAAGEDLAWDTLQPLLEALSRQRDPARASRPFDRDGDGFVATGGAVALVLEAAETTHARGAGAYAELLGWAAAPESGPGAAADPEGAGLASAMSQALVAAGVEAAELDYVNAHATSTPSEDASEARALHAVFTARGARPAVSSTKALTGHGRSMAGAMETAFCALALKEGFVPGAANLDHPHPACDGLHLPRATVERRLRFVLKNSSGRGSGHISVVLGRAP